MENNISNTQIPTFYSSGTTTTGQTYEYLSNPNSRKLDLAGEKIVGEWMDEYIYPQLQLTEFERVFDKARQVQGIDCTYNVDGITYLVDEKASLKYRNLPTFALEIWQRCRDGKDRCGWFADRNTKTNTYIFIFLDGNTPTPIHAVEDIQEAEVMVIDRKKLMNYVSTTIKGDKQILYKAIEETRKNTDKTYKYPIAEGMYCKCSNWKVEKPVNLIVRRDILRNLATKTIKYRR